MLDLREFGLKEMAELSVQLRKAGDGAACMEDVAQRVVVLLRGTLRDGRDGPDACPLVRFYKTHPYGELPDELQRFARGVAGEKAPADHVRCLTLLATAGEDPAWNDRRASRGHQAIPLLSEDMVLQAPMIASLISQFGLPVQSLVAPEPGLLLDLAQRTYNVFHVPVAPGSRHIPAQDFVAKHRIASALGFGGILPSGHLFAVIMFSRVPISVETAVLFRSQTLGLKLALLPFDGRRVFREVSP